MSMESANNLLEAGAWEASLLVRRQATLACRGLNDSPFSLLPLAFCGSWGKIRPMEDETIWLEGAISVEAALQGDCRRVEAVYVQEGNGRRWSRRVGTAEAHHGSDQRPSEHCG